MPRLLTLSLLVLTACPTDIVSGTSSTSDASETSPSTGGSSSSTSAGESSTSDGESSSTTGGEEVCLEVASPDGGEVYYLCGPDCSGGCPVDALHVQAACVDILPLGGKEPTSLCANPCKTDGWCADGETCLAITEGSYCVVLS